MQNALDHKEAVARRHREIEQSRKLSAEIDRDRFTRIDRAMTEEADERFLDLRHEPDDLRRQFDRTLRLRRLGKLEQMGPSHRTHAGRLGAGPAHGTDLVRAWRARRHHPQHAQGAEGR